MKLIKQSVELFEENNMFKAIETIGRISHKSENLITDTSAIPFFLKMLRIGHTSTLEFGNVYLATKNFSSFADYYIIDPSEFRTMDNPWIKVVVSDGIVMIYTNLKYILIHYPELFEDVVNDNVQYAHKFVPDDNDPYKRYTFKIITNRGISHELVRHRVFSFLQESTRYVKYDKGMEIIIPDWMTDFDIDPINQNDALRIQNCDEDSKIWHEGITVVEDTYIQLRSEARLQAQQARGILPNDLKTELYMSGFLKDWIGHSITTTEFTLFGELAKCTYRIGFDTLRNEKSAHPQAIEIASLVKNQILTRITEKDYNEIKESYL